jgi:PadR family transcriptional regulator, regulatory protein PadR
MPRNLGVTSLRILASIRDGTAYGLDIVTHTGMPSGTVYPTLGRLKKAGLVTSRWEDQRIAERDRRPRRRYYEITPEGSEALAEGIARLADAAADLAPQSAAGGG